MKRAKRLVSIVAALALALTACGGDKAGDAMPHAPAVTSAPDPTRPPASEPGVLPATTPSTTQAPSTTEAPSSESAPSPSTSVESAGFPTAVFAGLGEEPVSAELAAELQEVLDTSAHGDGLTATLITPRGTWTGATGFAAGDRPMTPDDQMSISAITMTVVAAQVMQLVDAGKLGLDDPVADRLPPDLEFDTNGATIVDLLSMRSGIPNTLNDEASSESLRTDLLRVWTTDEVLATVGPERGPVGQGWDFIGTNYVLLALIVEQVTGRPLAEALRSGVLAGDGYERLIYQPDERPTEPVALPLAAPSDTFDDRGGYLPSLAFVTAGYAESAMASDSLSLARWWKELCGGRIVSAASLDEMTDFDERPEYGMGMFDRSRSYRWTSAAVGHWGRGTLALCLPNDGIVVVVLANVERDVETLAGDLVRAVTT